MGDRGGRTSAVQRRRETEEIAAVQRPARTMLPKGQKRRQGRLFQGAKFPVWPDCEIGMRSSHALAGSHGIARLSTTSSKRVVAQPSIATAAIATRIIAG